MGLLVIYEKVNHKLVRLSGLAGRGVAQGGLPALPLRVLLENARKKKALQRWWRTPGGGYAETAPAGGNLP